MKPAHDPARGGLSSQLSEVTPATADPLVPADPAALVHSLEPGQTLGRFQVLEKLGEGGMGEVYAALDPELARKIAIKVINPSARSGKRRKSSRERHRAAQQLLHEARALAQVKHESIVPVYDVGEIDDCIYLAMQHLEGQTLGAWSRENLPSNWTKIRVMIQAGRAISAAHTAGLIHRDIKP